MPFSFDVPVDFKKNEAQNFVFHNLGTAPGSPVEGQVYYDTTGGDKIAYFWNGTAWRSMDAAAGVSGVATLSVDDITIEDIGTATDPDIRVKALGITNAHISASAAIVLSKLAVDPLARANHTGTQLAVTISDFDTQVRTNRLDQMAAPTASVSMNSQLLTNVLAPVSAGDATNKAYVDAAAVGIDWKPSVRVATTVAGTLATSFDATQTIDGVALVAGNRILIKNQAAPAENGIYVVAASGAPTRSTDADVSGEVTSGMGTFVSEGTVNGNTAWVLTTDDPITLNTTGLVFTQFAGPGSYLAGTGITLTGTTFSLTIPVAITSGGTGAITAPLARTSLVVPMYFAADIGDNSTTSIVVTHNVASRDVIVVVYDKTTPFTEIHPEVRHTSTTTCTLVFSVAPTTDQYRCVVIGIG